MTRIFKFKKYQRAVLGRSSSDSVATLGKNLEGHFPGLVSVFFLNTSQKKWSFDQSRIHFTKNVVLLVTEKTFIVLIIQ